MGFAKTLQPDPGRSAAPTTSDNTRHWVDLVSWEAFNGDAQR